MKKSWKFKTILVSLILVTACGPSTPAAEMAQSLGVPEGTLDIVTWPGYVEDGSVDPDFDWVTGFEQRTGCKVNVHFATTSDELYSNARTGAQDLIIASGDVTERLVQEGYAQAINPALIPGWSGLDQRIQGDPETSVDGRVYTVPFQWTLNRLLYSTEMFTTPPESWSVVFERQQFPDGQPNSDRIQAYEGPIYLATAALYARYKYPELGITDPYELNRVQFNQVVELARRQRKFVGGYWHRPEDQVGAFLSATALASDTFPFQFQRLLDVKAPVGLAIPVEGVTGRLDSFILSRTALHPNCAYLWIDHSLAPAIQGDVAAWAGSNPAVPAGCSASTLLGENGCAQNGYDLFEQVYFWKNPIKACGSNPEGCVPYNDWVTAYIAIIGGQ